MFDKIAMAIIMVSIMVTGAKLYPMETYNGDTNYSADIARVVEYKKHRLHDPKYDTVSYGVWDVSTVEDFEATIVVRLYDENDIFVGSEYLQKGELRSINEAINSEFTYDSAYLNM